jgi:NitT/TauT family transport system permease protein
MGGAELRRGNGGTGTADVESGLDVLDLPASRDERGWRHVTRIAVPKLVAAAVLLGVWQLVAATHLEPDYVIPTPAQVWSSFTEQMRMGNVGTAVWTSVSRGAEGYAIALLIGTLLGLLIARVQVVRLAIGSLVSALQSLPSVTWVGLALVWFGFNQTAVLFVVVMGAAPSIAGGMVAAIDHIPPLLLRVGDAMGARGLDRYRHIVLPAALPGYIAGMKQAWAFSWRSLMAAELIAGGPNIGLGLGQLLDTGRAQNDMALMVVTILLILAVGVMVDVLVFAPLDRGVRRRRGLAAA